MKKGIQRFLGWSALGGALAVLGGCVAVPGGYVDGGGYYEQPYYGYAEPGPVVVNPPVYIGADVYSRPRYYRDYRDPRPGWGGRPGWRPGWEGRPGPGWSGPRPGVRPLPMPTPRPPSGLPPPSRRPDPHGGPGGTAVPQPGFNQPPGGS